MKEMNRQGQEVILAYKIQECRSNLVQYDSYLILQGENIAAPRQFSRTHQEPKVTGDAFLLLAKTVRENSSAGKMESL